MFCSTFTPQPFAAMYQVFTFYHSFTRWLVLAAILLSIFRAYKGYTHSLPFTRTDDRIRHWTATVAHIQLLLGITLYTQSPVVKYFWHNFHDAIRSMDAAFFGLAHIVLMLTAIVIITIGSALAKRRTSDKQKFHTMLVWYTISLVIMLIAIPWPLSPFAHRPYFR